MPVPSIESLKQQAVPVILTLEELQVILPRTFHRQASTEKIAGIESVLNQGGFLPPIIVGKREDNTKVLLDGDARRVAALSVKCPLLAIVIAIRHPAEEIRVIESIHLQEALTKSDMLRLNIPSTVRDEFAKLTPMMPEFAKVISDQWDISELLNVLKRALPVEDLEDFLLLSLRILKTPRELFESKAYLGAVLTLWDEIKNSNFEPEDVTTYVGLAKHEAKEMLQLLELKKREQEAKFLETLKAWYISE